MKRVSYKVAKSIKEAGYPLERFQTVSRKQFEAGHGYKYSTDESFYSESPSVLHPEDNNTIDIYYCPTYLEVWLWLWREKKIGIDVSFLDNKKVCSINPYYRAIELNDPEESIITTIEYLVDNDYIK